MISDRAVELLEPRLLLDAASAIVQGVVPDLAHARPVDIDKLGIVEPIEGRIEESGTGQPPDVNIYSYVPQSDQDLYLQVTAKDSLERARLTALDERGTVLAEQEPADSSRANALAVHLEAGARYYFAVAAGAASQSSGEAGPYTLRFDDFPDTSLARGAKAIVASLNSGPVTKSGTIDTAEDDDFFLITPQTPGNLTIEVKGSPGLGPALKAGPTTGGLTAPPDELSASPDEYLATIAVKAGITYQVKVSAAASLGHYSLSLELRQPETPGPDFGTALKFNLDPTSTTVLPPATISDPAIAHFYRFTATRSTALVLSAVPVPGAGFGLRLSVYAEGPGDTKVALGPERSAAPVRVPVVAGGIYYVKVEASGTGTGAYRLNLVDDDVGDTFDTAQQLPDLGHQRPGTIEGVGDVDVYFFTAQADGQITVEQDAPINSKLDSNLAIFDASLRQIAFDDDSDSGLAINRSVPLSDQNSRVTFAVRQGQQFFIQAGAYANVDGSGATGSYVLSFRYSPVAQVAVAEDISPDYARRTGTIPTADAIGYRDYRFVARNRAAVQIRLDPADSGGFQGFLSAIDDQGRTITDDYSLRLLTGSDEGSIQFNVEPGRTYDVRVTAFRDHNGSYDLTLTSGPPVAPPPGAQGTFESPIDLAPDSVGGSVTVSGTIGGPGDEVVYRFVAARDETLRVRQFAAPGSRLDPYLLAFSDARSRFQDNDDSDIALAANETLDHVIDRNSTITLKVAAGQTYYFKATTAGANPGRYFLSLSSAPDDYADFVGWDAKKRPAMPAMLDGTRADQAGVIDMPGDLDAFQFTAPADGVVTIDERAAPGSSLDSQLLVFGPDRQPLASSNDVDGTFDSRVTFNVRAGQVYFVKASGYATSTGAYRLALRLEPAGASPGRSFATAITLDVPTPERPDEIEAPGAQRFYQFVAPRPGLLTVRMNADGSLLDSFLDVFDGSQVLLASNDDGDSGLDSLVRLPVAQGQTYVVRAAGFGASTGRFVLSLGYEGAGASPNDSAADFASARPLSVDSKSLTALAFGAISVAGEVVLYRFLAPVSGPLVVNQEAAGGSPLDSRLFLFDDSLRLISSGDDQQIRTSRTGELLPIADSQAEANVLVGHVYYIEVASALDNGGDPARSAVGAYRLRLAFPEDDFGNTFDEARTIIPPQRPGPDPDLPTGNVERAGDIDMFQIRTSGHERVTAVLEPAGGSGVSTVLIAYDADHREIARSSGQGITPASSVTFEVGPGAGVFYIEAGGYGDSTGQYFLHIDAIPLASPAPGTPQGPVGLFLQEPGKATLVQLRRTFTATIPSTGPTEAEQKATADRISDELVRQFLASLGGALQSDYVLIWADPVDLALVDSLARRDGYTAERGAIGEIGQDYVSGAGDLKLVIAPLVRGHYSLDLFGLGGAPILFGVRFILQDGRSVEPALDRTLPTPAPLAIGQFEQLVFSYDARLLPGPGSLVGPHPELPPVKGPDPSPSPTTSGPRSPLAGDGPLLALATAASQLGPPLIGGPFLARAIALANLISLVRATATVPPIFEREAVGLLTILVEPTFAAVPRLIHIDALPAPGVNLPAVPVTAAGAAQPSGAAVMGMVAGFSGGVRSLFGHVRVIIQSFGRVFAGPPRVLAKVSALGQPPSTEPGPRSQPSNIDDGASAEPSVGVGGKQWLVPTTSQGSARRAFPVAATAAVLAMGYAAHGCFAPERRARSLWSRSRRAGFNLRSSAKDTKTAG